MLTERMPSLTSSPAAAASLMFIEDSLCSQPYYVFSNFFTCLFLGMTNFYAGDNYRPSFIQDNDLRHLILKVSKEI